MLLPPNMPDMFVEIIEIKKSRNSRQIICCFLDYVLSDLFVLKGVFAKNERGYRLNAIKKRF